MEWRALLMPAASLTLAAVPISAQVLDLMDEEYCYIPMGGELPDP